MHPVVELTIDGRPVTGAFYERLLSVEVVDKEGVASDRFSAELNDGPPDFLALPRKGAIVSVSLGYRERGIQEMGQYTADQVQPRCLPYKLSISGKAADLRKGKLKEHQERHWDEATLGEIVEEIAGEAGLTARISDKLAAHQYKWLGQESETPIHFLERLARRHNALFSIKGGQLVFAERGSGLSASGAPLGVAMLTPERILRDTLQFEYNDRSAYSKVIAYYQDRDTAERVEIEVEGDAEGDATYRIPEPFADPAEAERAAEARARQLKRGEGSASVAVVGDTALMAGGPVIFQGIRPGLDGVPWIIETATHTLSKGDGYRTRLNLKLYDGESGADSAGGGGQEGGAAGSGSDAPAASDGDSAASDGAQPSSDTPSNIPAAPRFWGGEGF